MCAGASDQCTCVCCFVIDAARRMMLPTLARLVLQPALHLTIIAGCVLMAVLNMQAA